MARRHGLLPVSHPSTQLDNCTSRGTERRQPPSDWDLQRSFESVTDRLQLEPKALTGVGHPPPSSPPAPASSMQPAICVSSAPSERREKTWVRASSASGWLRREWHPPARVMISSGHTAETTERALLTGSERFTWRCNGNVMSAPNWNELTVSGDTSQDFTSFLWWIFCPILFYF